MKAFRYSFFANFVYWQANFPLSFIIFLHAIISALVIPEKPIYLIWLILDLAIIVILNWIYFKNYKIFPRKIDLSEDEIICYDFMFTQKKISLSLDEISEMKGGVLIMKPTKSIFIYSAKNNITIGIRPHLKDFNSFLTLILSKVNKEVYNKIINQAEELGKTIKNRREKRKSKKKKK
ncbi:MAG: hypothetical protein JXA68_04505 [Ignavibacteriales bacterium]|nr:hypothetical protein [Ignavibacteriales bacterium]